MKKIFFYFIGEVSGEEGGGGTVGLIFIKVYVVCVSTTQITNANSKTHYDYIGCVSPTQ